MESIWMPGFAKVLSNKTDLMRFKENVKGCFYGKHATVSRNLDKKV